MTEKSYLWSTGGAGDGAATYTRTDWSVIMRIMGAALGSEGVVPANWGMSGLTGQVIGANTVQIGSGWAVVDGKPYQNDAAVNVNIPSAVGGGNTRIDYIVLRVNWTAQTVRITRIAGTDAAIPTAPALQSSSGNVYDLPLYRATVDTAGSVSLADARTIAKLPDDSIEGQMIRDSAVGTDHLAGQAVTAAKMANGAIGSTQLADNAVTNSKMADNSVGTAEIIDNTVTDGKINGRVLEPHLDSRAPLVMGRLGGHGSVWNVTGDTSQSTSFAKIQVGAQVVTIANGADSGTKVITFPTAFSQAPIVICSPLDDLTSGTTAAPSITSATGCTIKARRTGTSGAQNVTVYWIAIGALP